MVLHGALNLIVPLLLCTGGCQDEALTAPRSLPAPSSAGLVVTSDSACAQLAFQITSPTMVGGTFPSRTSCVTNLVLIRAGDMMWAQNPSRRLRIRLRVLNKSGQSIQLPVRVFLPSNGTTVIAPSGESPTKVVAIEPDSSPTTGGKVWFVGGTGTLASNDSTSPDTLIFNVQSPITQARFQFQATALSSGSQPPPIPDSRRYPYDATMAVAFPSDTAVRFLRYLMAVRFVNSADGPAINQFLTHFNATVVGGIPSIQEYILQFPDPGPTWQAFDSLRSVMAGYPGVRFAVPITAQAPIGFDGRYPTDGTGSSRSDWFATSPSHAVWSRLAIRAPLAWGCETGAYGGAPVKIAVMDYFFDVTAKDWAGSTLHMLKPDPTLDTLISAPASYSIHPTNSHGTGVLGILAARGNDTSGVAGMLWKADLYLYQLSNQFKVPSDFAGYFAGRIVPDLKANGVRVFVTSTPIGTSVQQPTFRLALEDYLSWGGVVIEAAGNDGVIYSVHGFDTLQTAGTLGMQQALVSFFEPSDSSNLKRRVILVTGTAPGNTRWTASGSGARVITGATEIAAPAKDVVTFSALPGNPLWDTSGTSFAAPFVGGLAGQMLAMDPTLPADSIKDYILRGATQPRLNPSTGVPQAPVEVAGIPGVFQLDAYGSLSLLSRERSGTPICGYDVYLDPISDQVVLDKNHSNAVVLPATPPPSGWQVLSVAQGGRRIALGRDVVDSTAQVSIIDYLGNTLPSPNRVNRRIYLEQDTADIRFVAPPTGGSTHWVQQKPRLDLKGPGRTVSDSNRDIAGGVAYGDFFNAYGFDVSPTGAHVAIATSTDVYKPCPPFGNIADTKKEVYVVPLAGGTASLAYTSTFDGCAANSNNGPIANLDFWSDELLFSHDGSKLIIASPLEDVDVTSIATALRTHLSEYTLATGGVRPATVQDRMFRIFRYGTAEDLTLRGFEADLGYWTHTMGGTCWDQTRQVATLGGPIGAGTPASQSSCAPPQGSILMPNLRASRGEGGISTWVVKRPRPFRVYH